ncbi:hypothetical protein, partial [Enterococcus faecium]|uniref:hypothetical protein n=1 Tax=Enterococcus faecium TaxID=1352 RepID=UPI001D13F4A8
KLTAEFRKLSTSYSSHRDKLQAKMIAYHALSAERAKQPVNIVSNENKRAKSLAAIRSFGRN